LYSLIHDFHHCHPNLFYTQKKNNKEFKNSTSNFRNCYTHQTKLYVLLRWQHFGDIVCMKQVRIVVISDPWAKSTKLMTPWCAHSKFMFHSNIFLSSSKTLYICPQSCSFCILFVYYFFFFTKGFYLYFFPLLIVVFKYQSVLIFLLSNLAIIILLKEVKFL
jgi:hypothetical protein